MPRLVSGPAILACGALLASGVLLACGGGDGGGGPIAPPPGPVAAFQCSDSPPAPDRIVLQCGAKVAPDVWRIDVVIGVPTSVTDINEFDFDVVFDPLLLAFVPGSELAGNLLGQDGGTVWLAAATAPDNPGRLVVGTYREGSDGVAGMPGYEQIMSFQIKALTATPFGPVVPGFENKRASDPSGQTIPGIIFSDQLLLAVQ